MCNLLHFCVSYRWMTGKQSDIELIRQVLRENNSRAFEALMQRYTPQVYASALRLMKDEDEAAEVVQMAFIQAYKELDSWRGENFGAWVTVIANHTALRLLEKEKRRGDVRFDDVRCTKDFSEEADEPYDEQKEERLQSLEQALSRLPEQDRLIIEQHYYRNVPLADIARRLNQTENNIKVRLFRIRERLKKELKGEK